MGAIIFKQETKNAREKTGKYEGRVSFKAFRF